jgi:hypothetical protein
MKWFMTIWYFCCSTKKTIIKLPPILVNREVLVGDRQFIAILPEHCFMKYALYKEGILAA